MNRIVFFLVVFTMISSCGGRHGLFDKPADYLGGNDAAAIEQACYKRGSANKKSVAWDLCVQSYKIHYNLKLGSD